MFKFPQIIRATTLFFVLQDEIWSASSSNVATPPSNGRDPLYFMDLFKRLDTFVEEYVNVTAVGGGCGQLFIFFGDTLQEATARIVNAQTYSYPNQAIISKISRLEQNLGLNLSRILQLPLVCNNATKTPWQENPTKTALLPIVRNLSNSTSLEEFISENYFLSKIVTDHFSSTFGALITIHYPTLGEKLADLDWVNQLVQEMNLNSIIVITGLPSATNVTMESLTGMIRRDMSPERWLFGTRFTLLAGQHRVLLKGQEYSHPDQEAELIKFAVGANANPIPSICIPSSRLNTGTLQSLSTLLEEMHEKMVLKIVRNSSDCFSERLKGSDLISPSNKSLRHWEDSNYQRLLRMRGKLWSLSSPLTGLRLVEETLAEILKNGTNACNQTLETLLQLQRVERLFNTSKRAVTEYTAGLSRDSVIYLYQISTFFYKIYKTSWKVVYNQVVDPEPDSGIWYRFMHELFHQLSSPRYQQRRNLYNVQNIEDFGVLTTTNKPQGIHITAENFPNFLEKFKLFDTAFHSKLKLVDLTAGRLEEINSVVKGLLGQELSISCDNDAVTISGHLIWLSELLNLKPIEYGCPGAYGTLTIFATAKIYVDVDPGILSKFPDMRNLTLVAPFVYRFPSSASNCHLVVQYRSKDLVSEYLNTDGRVKYGSIFHATCPNKEETLQGELSAESDFELAGLGLDSIVTDHLSKTLNRYKLFARSNTINIHVTWNLMELLHSLESDMEILAFYGIEGFRDEFQLLSQDPFYQNNCTTDDLIFYLNTLSNNTQSYLETSTNNGESTNVNTLEITQLLEKIAVLIAKLKAEGQDKFKHSNHEDIEDSGNSHPFRNLALYLNLLGLLSCLIFFMVLAYKNQSNILEFLRHSCTRLSNGFHRLRN